MIDLKAIKKRCEAASECIADTWWDLRKTLKGTYRSLQRHREPPGCWIPLTDADKEFIEHSRQDIPSLIEEVERLRTELEIIGGFTCQRMAAGLEECKIDDPWCVVCRARLTLKTDRPIGEEVDDRPGSPE